MNTIITILLLYFLLYYLANFFLDLYSQRNNLLAQLQQFYGKLDSLIEAGIKKHGWENGTITIKTETDVEDYVLIKYGLMPVASKIARRCLILNIIPLSFVAKHKSVGYIKKKYQKYLPLLNTSYERFVIS